MRMCKEMRRAVVKEREGHLVSERTRLLRAVVDNLSGGNSILSLDNQHLVSFMFGDQSTHLLTVKADVVAAPVALVGVRAGPCEEHDKEEETHAEDHVHEVSGGESVRLRETEPGGRGGDTAGTSPFVVAVDHRVLGWVIREHGGVWNVDGERTSRR